jgi:hypothetical protein
LSVRARSRAEFGFRCTGHPPPGPDLIAVDHGRDDPRSKVRHSREDRRPVAPHLVPATEPALWMRRRLVHVLQRGDRVPRKRCASSPRGRRPGLPLRRTGVAAMFRARRCPTSPPSSSSSQTSDSSRSSGRASLAPSTPISVRAARANGQAADGYIQSKRQSIRICRVGRAILPR